MSLFVLWTGPVSTSNLTGIAWPADTTILVVNHGPDGGVGSSSFAALAAQYRGSDGRILPNLAKHGGYDLASFDQIAVMGFSAAHGALSQILRDDADGPFVNAAVSVDACFSAAGAPLKLGYEQFAAHAAQGGKLFVLAGSAGQNGPGLPASTTGWECAIGNAQGGASMAGATLSSIAVPAGVPTPKSAVGAGGLVALDYSGIFTHAQVVPKLTVPIGNAYLLPYLQGGGSMTGASPVASAPLSTGKAVVVGLGLAALLGGGLYAWRRWG